MALKFRKKIKILPGVNLNLSRKGISTTVGVKGASVNIGKKGAYLNTGIPGTGIYNRQKIGGGKQVSSDANTQVKPMSNFTIGLIIGIAVFAVFLISLLLIAKSSH